MMAVLLHFGKLNKLIQKENFIDSNQHQEGFDNNV